PPAWTQAGMLRCVVNPSIGFIIAGHQSMECTFTQTPPIPPQAYGGALNMIGLNIGITAGGVFGWAVLAPTVGIPAGALAGEYVGASGDIGLGPGCRRKCPGRGLGAHVRVAACLTGGLYCRRRGPRCLRAQTATGTLRLRFCFLLELADVRFWHLADVPTVTTDVRVRGDRKSVV